MKIVGNICTILLFVFFSISGVQAESCNDTYNVALGSSLEYRFKSIFTLETSPDYWLKEIERCENSEDGKNYNWPLLKESLTGSLAKLENLQITLKAAQEKQISILSEEVDMLVENFLSAQTSSDRFNSLKEIKRKSLYIQIDRDSLHPDIQPRYDAILEKLASVETARVESKIVSETKQAEIESYVVLKDSEDSRNDEVEFEEQSMVPTPSANTTRVQVPQVASATGKSAQNIDQNDKPNYYFYTWLACVLVGTVAGLQRKVVIFRDYDDLALCFATLAAPLAVMFVLQFVNIGNTGRVGLLLVTVFSCVAGVVYITWKTGVRWMLPVVLITKISWGVLFILAVWQLLAPGGKNREQRQQSRALAFFFLTVSTPIIAKLVDVKEGRFFNPSMIAGRGIRGVGDIRRRLE